MIRVAHTGDIHYCEKHLKWVDKAFGFFVEHAITARAEVGVLAGDIFDAGIALHHPVVEAVITKVKRLADHMPVFMIYGTASHDRPGSLDVFRHVGSCYPIYVASEPVQMALWEDEWHPVSKMADRIIAGGKVDLLVSALPSANKAAFVANDADIHVGEELATLMQQWAVNNRLARSRGIPTTLITHGTVNGCKTESKQSMVSPDWEFTTGTLFSADASAVMINHIHQHQAWRQDGRCIAYPGSITKLIYGHDDPTGLLAWEVGADGAEFTFVETPARRLIDIEFSGAPDLQEFQRRLAGARDGYVRVRYQIDEEHRRSVDQQALKDMLSAAGVADFKIEPRINPIVRSRADGIHLAPTVADKVTRWCELTGTDPVPLLARLKLLEAGLAPGAKT